MLVVAAVPLTGRAGPEGGGYYPSCLWDGLPFPEVAPLGGRRCRFLLASREAAPAAPRLLEPLPELARRHPEVRLVLARWDPGPRWVGRAAPARSARPAGEDAPFFLLAVLAAFNVLQPAPLPPPLLAEEACRLLCRAFGPPADLACLRAAAAGLTVAALPCMKGPAGGNIPARR